MTGPRPARQPAHRIGYGAVHRVSNEILFVEWTRRDARELLLTLEVGDRGLDPKDYRIERLRVVSFVR